VLDPSPVTRLPFSFLSPCNQVRFRLGEFDTLNPANPFRGPFNESDLDSATHRALAREAAAKSYVLLENRAGRLMPCFRT
jgi:beta-glucosidase-like glycosyl hydrolase